MARPAHDGGKRVWLVVLAIFVVLRVVCWSQTTVLDDHDSVSYMADASAWRSLDAGRIAAISPDSAPLYPIATAIVGIPGWSMEFAARLASLACSVATFLLAYGIGRRFGTTLAVVAGLSLFALNPTMIQLAIAIVSEPAYLAATYLGLWWFRRQVGRPTPVAGLVAGVFFSLTFLARTEGLLFLAAVPVLQIAHAFIVRERRYTTGRLAAWCGMFLLGFALLSSLQVLDVSRKMGQFAINGREVWQSLLNRPDVPSNDAAIYGLDYSPSRINLHYVREHPEVAAGVSSSVGPGRYARLVVKNVITLVRETLGELFGWVLLLFAAAGVIALARDGRRYDAFLLVAFPASCIAGPLLHSVPVHHIAVVAPLVMLAAGVGLAWFARRAAVALPVGEVPAVALLTVLLAATWFPGVYAALVDPPSQNTEYSPAAITRMAGSVNRLAARSDEPVRIMARKSYLVYSSEAAQWVTLPFTDYEGLVRYARLNEVDFVFLERELVRKFPFVDAFTTGEAPDFTLIEAMDDDRGRRLELWALRED